MFFLCIPLILVLVQLIRFLYADCDLHLQLYTIFGRNPESLRGKVVWITGSSSGIGEALAYRLSAAGCKVILSARRKDRLKAVKQNCIKKNSNVDADDLLVLPVDLLDFRSHLSAMETALKYFKRIDILVNNAGRSQRALLAKTSLEVDEEMLKLNVLGQLSITKSVLHQMINQNSGHVVVTSSIAGKLGAPGLGSYSASKHALHGWYEVLRIEGFHHNIGVTMVCPGPVFSEALVHAFTERREKTLGIEMKSDEKRMSAERCAHLMAVAIANRLDEVWLSPKPELFYLYLYQYFPTIARRLGKHIGSKRVAKVRAGIADLH